MGIDNIVRRWNNVADINAKKIELIRGLSPEERERSERLLREFFKWIDSIHRK